MLAGSHYLWSLFFINSLLSKMLFVWEIFSNSHSDCFNNREKNLFSAQERFLDNLLSVDANVTNSVGA